MKWFVLFISINGVYSSASLNMLEVADHAECDRKGQAFVKQMNEIDLPGLGDHAKYACIMLPE